MAEHSAFPSGLNGSADSDHGWQDAEGHPLQPATEASGHRAPLFPGLDGEDEASLETWRRLCLSCRRCALREGARGVVFGEGNPHAAIMFVGEGPGSDEDKLGRPFVGAAGQLLDRILTAAGLAREDVYIANVVKCRPPGNRLPQRDEIAACLPLLGRQISLVDPLIIVCLGAVAAQALIRPDFAITRERGCWHELGKRLVMPTFHPAALLRDPNKKKAVWADMQQVVKLYARISGEEG